MPTQDDPRLDPGYDAVRHGDRKWLDYSELEVFLGRPLTHAEELAVYDNRQDQVLVDMGR